MNKRSDKKYVLLIDPDDVCRRIVAQRLSIAGYEVIQSSDGAAAIPLVKEKNPDIVISELSMPKVNGTQLCSRIKQNPQTARIPIIILSSKNMIQDKIAALDAGAHDYITKPFSLSELEARIRAALRS